MPHDIRMPHCMPDAGKRPSLLAHAMLQNLLYKQVFLLLRNSQSGTPDLPFQAKHRRIKLIKR